MPTCYVTDCLRNWKNAKFCSAGGLFLSLKQILGSEIPLSSILGAKTWKKVKISRNFRVFEFSKIGPFQKVKYFMKKWFWSRPNASKWSKSWLKTDFEGFQVILDPPQSRNQLFLVFQTISTIILGTKGKFPTNFYNHKWFVSALS